MLCRWEARNTNTQGTKMGGKTYYIGDPRNPRTKRKEKYMKIYWGTPIRNLRSAHHGPAVSRFLVSNGSTNGSGCLRGLLRLIKTHFENISGRPFWDRDPRYPSGVPWDQKIYSPEIFSKWVLFNLSNPLRHPAPLVDPLLTKNLDTAGPWW